MIKREICELDGFHIRGGSLVPVAWVAVCLAAVTLVMAGGCKRREEPRETHPTLSLFLGERNTDIGFGRREGREPVDLVPHLAWIALQNGKLDDYPLLDFRSGEGKAKDPVQQLRLLYWKLRVDDARSGRGLRSDYSSLTSNELQSEWNRLEKEFGGQEKEAFFGVAPEVQKACLGSVEATRTLRARYVRSVPPLHLSWLETSYLYCKPYAIQSDADKGWYWTLIAAENGDRDAQYDLALLLDPETDADKARSIFWLRKSAKSGEAKAKSLLKELTQRSDFKRLMDIPVD